MSCIKFPGSKSDDNHKKVNSIEIENDSLLYKQLIQVANETFGYGKWSHAVTSQSLDFIDYVNGKYHAACTSTVRIQLLDGTFHEDIGFSSLEGFVKGIVINYVKSSSITNALKKVLSCFGKSFDIALEKLSVPKKTKLCNATTQTKNIIDHSNSNNQIKGTDFTESLPEKEFMEDMDFDDTFNKAANNKVNGIIASTNGKEPISSTSKGPSVSTAMTEEEMRLERKRKQREKQEEFKKKYQSNGNIKSINLVTAPMKTPNPRY